MLGVEIVCKSSFYLCSPIVSVESSGTMAPVLSRFRAFSLVFPCFAALFLGAVAAFAEDKPNYIVRKADSEALVRLRKGPSTRGEALAYIHPDTVVASAGECEKEWCKVLFKGFE